MQIMDCGIECEIMGKIDNPDLGIRVADYARANLKETGEAFAVPLPEEKLQRRFIKSLETSLRDPRHVGVFDWFLADDNKKVVIRRAG